MTVTTLRRVADEFAASSEALRSYARQLGADPATAEDAVAEAFATVLAFTEERLIAIHNLRAYLYTTTRHLVRRAQSAATRTVAADDETLDRPVPDDTQRLAARSSLALARQALGALDETQRTVLLAMLVEDRTPAEAGRLIGVTASHASTILHRARAALRVEYVRSYLELTPPACGIDVRLLARIATDRASRRDAAAYRRHVAGCAICPRLERGAREELRSGSLLTILLLVLAAGGTLARGDTALALALPDTGPRRRAPLLAAGGVLALAGLVTVALLPLSGTLARPSSWSLGVDAASVRIEADPELVALTMPAPGERASWTARVTSSSTSTVALYAEVVAPGSPTGERPRLLLSRDGAALGAPVPLAETRGSMSVGRLEPGESAAVEGVVIRDRADTDQSLSGRVTVRFWATSDLDAAPPGGWRDAGDELPETGADPGAAAGARGDAAGRGSRTGRRRVAPAPPPPGAHGPGMTHGLPRTRSRGRRVRAGQPPAAGGVRRDSASSSTRSELWSIVPLR
ncbi:RNA polymerase sigma factor [Microbacterium sp. SORGH_AS_0888]|uniref:RNA polymerase sigma factor n=1 Tax=Microbacterium sp. SORGH_AS_0888 TaxID=3041791 RepID=UPI0027D8C214|nr:sigma-70 family RNA polymerase sigma factor [Microbacterium sp. SORGH_AS_0888]